MKGIITTLVAGLLVASLFAPTRSQAQQWEAAAKGPKLTLNSVEAQVTALQGQVASLQSTVKSLQSAVDSLDTAVSSLQPNFAVVRNDGTLAHGSVSVVSTKRLGNGMYQVIFNRNVTGCEFNASIGGPAANLTFGFIGAVSLAGNDNGVFVGTAILLIAAESPIDFADLPFELSVICPIPLPPPPPGAVSFQQ